MQRIHHLCRIVENRKVCPAYYRLALDAPAIAGRARAGQFIHIRVTDGLEPFFRRPFSVYRSRKHLEVLYEPVGRGTRLLAAKKRGDVLDVLGPLGHGFHLPPAKVKQAVMIAGGMGIAPFMILSDELGERTKCRQFLLYGAAGRSEVFSLKAFKDNGCKVSLATEDASAGVKGRVTALFNEIPWDPATTFVYTCGPRPMMKAVQEFAAAKGVAGEASGEEVMACGLGACLGCSTPTRTGYKTVCYDGPVFALQETVSESFGKLFPV